jgi:hypothetical protein
MLHELKRIHSERPEVFEHQEIPPEVEAAIWDIFKKYEDSLVAAAISAEQRAVHWDDAKRRPKMHVGCSVLVLDKSLDLSKLAIYTGANSKPKPGFMLPYPQRKCAEMNALENILGVDYKGKISLKPFEEVEKEDLGLILAIVTASESHNTGEEDTIDHKVVYSCKQCQTNYKYLEGLKVLSPKTVIYNIRTKDGKKEVGEPMPLGEMFSKFEDSKTKTREKSLREFVETKNEEIRIYLQKLEIIKFDINDRILGAEGTLEDEELSAEIEVLEREGRERISEAKQDCVSNIYDAWQSAEEEGVGREDLYHNFYMEDTPGGISRPISRRDIERVLEAAESDAEMEESGEE